jgi:uracil-DNA glycosylase
VNAHVFLWNVFPFHPHEPQDPFTNRAHRSVERKVGEELLVELIAILHPRRLVAIGNDAAKSSLKTAGSPRVVQVRHPSYGGQRDFIRQVRGVYDLTIERKQLTLL